MRGVQALARRVVGQEQRVLDLLAADGVGEEVQTRDGQRLVGGVGAVAPLTEPSKEFSNSFSTATSLRPGWTKTVPCSAAGMFHSRPWKTRVPEISPRAATICGLTFSTPILACCSLPWSVMTIQSRPLALAWRTWSMTRYLASELNWVWMWWSPASHR